MVRRSTLAGIVLLGALVESLAFGGAAALATPPEMPATGTAESVGTATATLHGVLNPGAKGEPGSYQFFYAPSETECTGGGVAPASPALAMGAEKEAESVNLTGLEPNRQYEFCIVAFSLSAEAAFGAAVPFKTLPLPPKIDSESNPIVQSTEATLEAQVNPNNQATSYTFEYSTKATGEKLEPPIVKVNGASALMGFGDQTASVSTGAILSGGETYFYRVVAENEQSKNESKPVEGPVQSFTTVPAPHTEAVTSITPTTATFNGTLTSLNATVNTEYFYVYKLSPTGTECFENSVPAAPASAGTGAGIKAVPTPVTELQPSATYAVCLISMNAFGLEVDLHKPHVSFTTPAAPPKIDSEETSGVTPFEATLNAQVNPNNQTTTCIFEYSTEEAGKKLAGKITTLKSKPLMGFGDKTASAVTGQVLTPGTTYYYRVVAENAAHEKAEGKVEAFSTPTPTAPVVESEGTPALTPFAATLGAVVNPDYQETTCEFEYAASEAAIGQPAATKVPCPKPLGSGGPGTGGAVVNVTGLTSKTPYYFRVIATNATGKTTGTITKFETSATKPPAVEGEIVESGSITSNNAKLEAAIRPNYQETTYKFEYATSEAALLKGEGVAVSGGSIPAGGVGQLVGPVSLKKALAPETLYFYRVVAENEQSKKEGKPVDGPAQSFTTLIAPVVTTAPAQKVTRTTATLSGTVNPTGVETNSYYVYTDQKGYEEALAQSAANPYVYGRTTPEVPVGSDNTVHATVPLEVSGLAPGTVYHYAVAATNIPFYMQMSILGTTVIGPDMTFTTAPPIGPIVSGVSVSGITESAASIAATVDGRGLPTHWELQLGTTQGLELAASGHTTGSATELAVNIGPLIPGTLYHYKLIAVNFDGASETPEATFTTAPAPPSGGNQLTPIPLLHTPAGVTFPPPPGEEKIITPRKLTNAQKLSKALKACQRKPKSQRAACIKQAHKRYGGSNPRSKHGRK